jgi:hypothetical protein
VEFESAIGWMPAVSQPGLRDRPDLGIAWASEKARMLHTAFRIGRMMRVPVVALERMLDEARPTPRDST